MGTLSLPCSNNKLLLLVALSSLVGPSYAWGTNCSYDQFGVERCDGLSYGARVGVAVAIIAILVLLLGLFFIRKRRLAQQQQEAALANGGRLGPYPQQGIQQSSGVPMYGYAPQQGYNNNGVNNAGGPQYYENPQSQTYNYGPSAEVWQPPPPKYEPPPPADSQNGYKGPEQGRTTTENNEQSGYNVNASTTEGCAPPAGPPPGVSDYRQTGQGNENRV